MNGENDDDLFFEDENEGSRAGRTSLRSTRATLQENVSTADVSDAENGKNQRLDSSQWPQRMSDSQPFSQRHNLNSSRLYNASTVMDGNESITNFLKSIGVTAGDTAFVLGSGIRHEDLVKKLDLELLNRQTRQLVLSQLKETVNRRSKFDMFLNPMISEDGVLPCLFRAFLLSRHSSADCIEHLMIYLEQLALSSDKANHQKGKGYVFLLTSLTGALDCRDVIASIFTRKIPQWAPMIRESLIEIIPQILTDFASHNEMVSPLKDLVIQIPSSDAVSFRKGVFSTLRTLRAEVLVLREARRQLCESIMEFDSLALPDLTEFLVGSFSTDRREKLYNILWAIREHLDVEKLKRPTDRRITTAIVIQRFICPITEYVAIDVENNFEDVEIYFRTVDAKAFRISGRGSGRPFNVFDMLLALAFLEKDIKSAAVKVLIRKCLQVQDDSAEILKRALIYLKADLSFLLDFAGDLLKCSDASCLASTVYTHLLVNQKLNHEKVVEVVIRSLPLPNASATIICSLEGCVADDPEVLMPYLSRILAAFPKWKNLSVYNLRRVLSVLVKLYSIELSVGEGRGKRSYEIMMSAMSSCVDDNEKAIGVLGLLMQLKVVLKESSLERERIVSDLLKTLLSLGNSSPLMRSFVYEQLAIVLRSSSTPNCRPLKDLFSNAMVDFKKFFSPVVSKVLGANDDNTTTFNNPDAEFEFCPPKNGQCECVPLFDLLKELKVLICSWSPSEKELNDCFNFVIESNISISKIIPQDDEMDGNMNAEKLQSTYFVIDYLRTVLTTFSKSAKSIQEENLVRKCKLLLMLQNLLIDGIDAAGSFRLPLGLSVRAEVTVISEKLKKKKAIVPKKRKRTSDGDLVENDGDEQCPMTSARVGPTQAQTQGAPSTGSPSKGTLSGTHVIELHQLIDHFRPLALSTVCRILKILSLSTNSVDTNEQKNCSNRLKVFLVREAHKLLEFNLEKVKKKNPFKAKSSLDLFASQREKLDTDTLWKELFELFPVLWKLLNGIVDYLRDEDDMSQGESECKQRIQAGSLEPRRLVKSLLDTFSLICNSHELTANEVDNFDEQQKRRKKLFQLVEEQIDADVTTYSQVPFEKDQGAEQKFLGCLIDRIATNIPSLESAIPLLDIVNSFPKSIWDPEFRGKMIFQILGFLQKEWYDELGVALKGAAITQPLKMILENLFRMPILKPKRKLSTMQWMLANKVAKLVPDVKNRRSIAEQCELDSPPGLSGDDFQKEFSTFNHQTFTVIYKVLFSALVATVREDLQTDENWKNGEDEAHHVLAKWIDAAKCFGMLGLFLRVAKLRNSNVLVCAVKEGKGFLSQFTKNSVFMQVLVKYGGSAKLTPDVSSIVKLVQMGNRNIQNICIHAKKMKHVVLLRLLPEFRCVSEEWMRTISEALTAVGHREAIVIGLLKSRDLDGNEIRDESSESENSDREETAEPETRENASDNEDESRATSPVY